VIAAALAKRIKLVGLDVDGVLTDGGIYLGDVGGVGLELKRYDIQDGLGIRLLRASGIKVVIITGRVSESVRQRATELEVDDLVQDGQARKLSALHRILDRFGISLEDSAFVGDDFPDHPVLRAVGLPVAVGNAVPEIRALCKVQLTRTGGFGAVREFAELLLKARGDWERVVSDYLVELIDTKLEVLR
jgi:3-deoxy-D-manno-octulosonate 8-phosphate phosphatase (KDO 8-P phosphatase)